jgi:hypothetical protein
VRLGYQYHDLVILPFDHASKAGLDVEGHA